MGAKRRFTESSGNVFEDLGLPSSKELAVKADLVAAMEQRLARPVALGRHD